MARIDTLGNFLTDVAAAIKEKTGKSDPITPANFDTEISGITTGSIAPEHVSFKNYSGLTLDLSGLDTSNITDMSNMFYNNNKLSYLDLRAFNTSKVNNMENMFYYLGNSVTEVVIDGLNNFDTSKVQIMTSMFDRTSLKSLDLSNFNTSNVTNMSAMFQHSSKLANINVSNFNTSKVTDMRWMFVGVAAETIDISSFTSESSPSTSQLFAGCTNLKNVIINNQKMFKIRSTDIFTQSPYMTNGTGSVYVPDGLLDAYKADTYWSTYSNILKGMSEYIEE